MNEVTDVVTDGVYRNKKTGEVFTVRGITEANGVRHVVGDGGVGGTGVVSSPLAGFHDRFTLIPNPSK